MDHYIVRAVEHPHPITACVPGSKSITNRALLIGALAEGNTRLSGILFSDDSRHFLQSLNDLGFTVSWDEKSCTANICGLGGILPEQSIELPEQRIELPEQGIELPEQSIEPSQQHSTLPETRRNFSKSARKLSECSDSSQDSQLRCINVGSAGTAARFLTAYLGLSAGRCRIDSSEQMKKRPMKELLDALRQLGADVSFEEEEDHFPLIIGNPGLTRNEVTVDVDRSSQFLSALLISSVLFKNGLTIHVTGSHGMAYVEMTVKMMEQFGVRVERFDQAGYTVNYRIPAGSAYRAMDYAIEPDVSAACYFYAMGLVLSVPAQVQGVHFDCLQGDIRFLQVLKDMGASFTDKAGGVQMQPPVGKSKGGRWNLAAFSDQTLTLAAIAPFADSAVRIDGIGHIRFQECDRINAILTNLTALGINCREEEGSIIIQPGIIQPGEPLGSQSQSDPADTNTAFPSAPVRNEATPVRNEAAPVSNEAAPVPTVTDVPYASPVQIETYGDHRVAMSFTITGLKKGGVDILDPMCCRKTFENYYRVLEEAVY